MYIEEESQQLMNRFIEQLESIGIDIGTRLDQIEKDKKDYDFFQYVRNALEESKEDFCASYFELEEEDKEVFQKRLLRLFKDQEIVDNIMQEIVNLFYLKESGLIDLEEIAPQKELAYENLETLSTKIEKFLQETNIDQMSADEERLSSSIDRLVDLGSILEGEVSSPVEDIDYLEEMLEMSSLTDREKKEILKSIIEHNIAAYKESLEEKSNKVSASIEQAKEDTKVELEEMKENPTITPECMREINELLSKKEIIQKIVRIVNDDFTMIINITSPTPAEREQIASSIELAREDMIASIEQNHELTPREALELFFQKYDETLRRKKEILGILFEDSEESTLSEEEQKEKVREGLEFLESRRQLVSTLSREDKERIHSYMRDLYNKKENREIIYESKAYVSAEEVEKDAAYEIQVIRELLEAIGEDEKELYSKISKRIEDILDCVDQVNKIEAPKTQDEGNVFFLMKSQNESQLEFDLGLNSKIKGLSTQFINEIRNQIESIASRGERKLISAQPVNPSYKYIRKQGVRYTTGSRTKVFFIPVGKKDAIIIGASFVDGKDILRDQDMKIKRHSSQIDALKDRLSSPDTYSEETKRAEEVRNRVMQSFENKELDEMFVEVDPESIEQKKI